VGGGVGVIDTEDDDVNDKLGVTEEDAKVDNDTEGVMFACDDELVAETEIDGETDAVTETDEETDSDCVLLIEIDPVALTDGLKLLEALSETESVTDGVPDDDTLEVDDSEEDAVGDNEHDWVDDNDSEAVSLRVGEDVGVDDGNGVGDGVGAMYSTTNASDALLTGVATTP
jgi:hypothetical protein